jgi:hypothetical protein
MNPLSIPMAPAQGVIPFSGMSFEAGWVIPFVLIVWMVGLVLITGWSTKTIAGLGKGVTKSRLDPATGGIR